MRKSDDIDNVLNECLERLLLKGETIEQCLTSYPEQAAELEPLLQTALAAKTASAIQPRPEFRNRARYQFQAALREEATRRHIPFFGWQPRWATAVAIVLILLLAGGGTMVTAVNSMPDEPLYSTKLAIEEVRVKMTPSELGKAQLYAGFADKRVREIALMAKAGKPELVEQTAQRLDTHLAMIVFLVSTPEKEPAMMLAPPPAAKAPAPTEEAGGGETPAPATEIDNEQAELRATLAYYAINHPEALRAAMNEAPESAKLALRRTIDNLVERYEETLEAIEH